MINKALVKNSQCFAGNNNDLQILAQSLIDYLNEEIIVYHQLYKLINKEKEILENPSIEDLNVNNSLKEKYFIKVSICRDLREEIILEMKKKYYNDTSRNINITQISKCLKNDIKKQLRECYEKLYKIANSVKKINHRNKRLIMNAILYSKVSLNFLQKNKSVQINYRRSGQLDISLFRGAILNRNI